MTPVADGALGQTDDALEGLSRLELFRDLSIGEKQQLAKFARIEKIPQDRVIPRGTDATQDAAYYFLLRGKVAFAEFAPGTVPHGEPNKKKLVTPTMQVAKRVVSLFDVGDFFTNTHVAEARGSDGEKYEMALFSCVHIILLVLPKKKLEQLLLDVPKLKEAIEIRAEEAYYRQTFLKLDERADLMDFYVKEGFEYAKAIKIIQTDKCIDCDECIKACEDRHGIARIERFGPRIGLIQFTQNCRTCQDARCIDVCNFDAIGYDETEEVIVYDNCVGCTLCAKACPHDAVRMVDIQEDLPPSPDENLKVKTNVAKGEENAKKKKPKRIANKCDHCFGFADMACISACPTGAIIQIDPRALFRRDGGYIDRAEHYFDTAAFEYGYSQTTQTQGVRGMRFIFYLVGLFALGCGAEYFARKFYPNLAFLQYVFGLFAQDTSSLAALPYAAARGMGRWMGYLGASMMILSALYTLRVNIPGLRRMGSSQTWFNFHVVFGLCGPFLALLHTDMNVFQLSKRPLVTILWWSIPAIVLSGTIGRWFYTFIPKLEAASLKEKRRLDEGIQKVADQWASMTQSVNVLDQFMKAQEKLREQQTTSATGSWWLLIKNEFQGFWAKLRLRFGFMAKMRNAKLRKTALQLMSRRAVLESRAQFYGLAKQLLAQWRSIHIAITLLMFVLLTAHVAISVYAVGW